MTVTVISAATAIQELIALVDQFQLHKGISNSLLAKLASASRSLDQWKEKPAKNKLNAFINEVEAQAGKKIPEEQAAELISMASRIVSSI